MTKKISLSSLLLLGLGCVFSATTAADSNSDYQTWTNITATGSLGFINPHLKRYRYWLEGQGRFGNDSSRVSQGIVRAGLGYRFVDTENDKMSFWLGYAYVPTDEPFTQASFDEHRIWQQLLWNGKYSFGLVTSRSRLEQRYLPTGSDVGWRYRQLLKVEMPMSFAPSFNWVLADEYFVNINDTDWGASDGFDQNRAFAGVGYNFDSHIKTEVGYMNQYIRKLAGPDLVDHILSVNLFLDY